MSKRTLPQLDVNHEALIEQIMEMRALMRKVVSTSARGIDGAEVRAKADVAQYLIDNGLLVSDNDLRAALLSRMVDAPEMEQTA